MPKSILPCLLLLLCVACSGDDAKTGAPAAGVVKLDPIGDGTLPVATSNIEIADEFAAMDDQAMHEYLLGHSDANGQERYLADILKYPDAAWLDTVHVPDTGIYGPARGRRLPVVSFVTYPAAKRTPKPYAFPYHDSRYGIVSDMLGPEETPQFADPDERYPLIILSHGAQAHGIYDLGHAEKLASHGFIVVTINYGGDRMRIPDTANLHLAYLRPLITSAVLTSLLGSDAFGGHIDSDNIGISGHSFGGFTALAAMGGRFLTNPGSVVDRRIKAATIAAPWLGGRYNGKDLFPFGPDNSDLDRVDGAVICLFSHKDEATLSSFILPSMKHLGGPTYVVELVDQPHVFEGGSWLDRDNWELLFFVAYLKHDATAKQNLRQGQSMNGGNKDVQLFEYQKINNRVSL